MSENCQMVVFSNKAYNAIIRESFDKDPVETGGILLGHILDNGIWIVMEVLPPGIHCIFEHAYFEYDDAFVNYLAQSVANQYKIPLELLGLWHRHPGSMDFFSSTDDQTNSTFAAQNRYGVISGLVNIDPQFRLTMYHLNRGHQHVSGSRPAYEKVAIEVGDDIIPEECFELRYYDGENSNLHPRIERTTRQARETHTNSSERGNPSSETNRLNFHRTRDESVYDGCGGNSREFGPFHEPAPKSLEERIADVIRFFRRNRFILILLMVLIFGLSLKVSWNYIKNAPKTISEWISKKDHDDTEHTDITTKNLYFGQTVKLSNYLPDNWNKKGVVYTSDSESVSIKKDIGTAVAQGEATIYAKQRKGKAIAILKLIVTKKQYRLNHNSISLPIGESSQLSLTPNSAHIQWKSDNSSVVKIHQDGHITAVSAGETIIHVIVDGIDVASCSIQVTEPEDKDDEVNLTETYTLFVDNGKYSEGGSLPLGAVYLLKYKTNIPQQELSNIVWESSNPSVASIDSNGKIHVLGVGTAIMTVKYNELSSSWKLTVKQNEKGY